MCACAECNHQAGWHHYTCSKFAPRSAEELVCAITLAQLDREELFRQKCKPESIRDDLLDMLPTGYAVYIESWRPEGSVHYRGNAFDFRLPRFETLPERDRMLAEIASIAKDGLERMPCRHERMEKYYVPWEPVSSPPFIAEAAHFETKMLCVDCKEPV